MSVHSSGRILPLLTKVVFLLAVCSLAPVALAQDNVPSGENLAEQRLQEAMADRPAPTAAAATPGESINLLKLASPSSNGGGGPFMVPIYFFSLLTAMFAFERAFALRRRKIIPPELVEAFGNLANSQASFDPRKAYRICQQYPSTAANVIRAMLLKIGRPHAEVESAVAQAEEREAAKLYSNVRPLNLSASAAPLLGLLGTVQGMIMAFWTTAHMPEDANKAQQLAEGVYVALVTTFAGLCVAIPAVVIAHFFEGKIQRLFRELDDLLFNLMPQLERYEGKLRVSRAQLGESEKTAPEPEIPVAPST
jgi:biopolymer transport protein ExbB